MSRTLMWVCQWLAAVCCLQECWVAGMHVEVHDCRAWLRLAASVAQALQHPQQLSHLCGVCCYMAVLSYSLWASKAPGPLLICTVLLHLTGILLSYRGNALVVCSIICAPSYEQGINGLAGHQAGWYGAWWSCPQSKLAVKLCSCLH